MCNQYDFSDIAPFEDKDFPAKMAQLVKEPGFEHAVRYAMPNVDYSEFVKMLLTIPDKDTFQVKVMFGFLKMIEGKTTSGISMGGIDNVNPGMCYTYLSNHRDIVLDASFLNYSLLKNNLPTSEIAIGNNLLIFDWITDLVKLNKSFIVKRNLPMTKALEAAKCLSAYIHFAVNQKHQSVWIAQREGRAKDSNDLTQESLLKMLALGGSKSFVESLKDINIMPLSISYEYDPNDYLKAKEFLMKKLNPDFKKSQQDDLLSMETGLMQYKGHVHFELTPCINECLSKLDADMPKVELVRSVCQIIDNAIHAAYKIYPINYVAYDIINGNNKFADHYTLSQKEDVLNHVEAQLDKVGLDNISADDRQYMRDMMFAMYANPLRNKLVATN